jgi:dipeptidase E
MKLFLASEAKHPNNKEILNEFVGGFKGKTIAYIPTASNGYYFGSWKSGGSIQYVQQLEAKVEIIELENSHYSDIKNPLKQADIIWMAGGMSGFLLYWLRRTECDKLLPDLLEYGAIYIGSSAGSMICSKSQQVNEIYIDEKEPGASIIPGLGIIDFEIYPHYKIEDYQEIAKSWDSGKLCLLQDGEAVLVNKDEVTVFGEEKWIIK